MKYLDFEWMVYDRITRKGIYFYGSKSGKKYIFYWNPLRTLNVIFSYNEKLYFGFFPLTKNHIKL